MWSSFPSTPPTRRYYPSYTSMTTTMVVVVWLVIFKHPMSASTASAVTTMRGIIAASPWTTSNSAPAVDATDVPGFEEAQPQNLKPKYKCGPCGRYFHGETCFQNHQKFNAAGKESSHDSICKTIRRCPRCKKLNRTLQEIKTHVCGYASCPTCLDYVLLEDHKCFIESASKVRAKRQAAALQKKLRKTPSRKPQKQPPQTRIRTWSPPTWSKNSLERKTWKVRKNPTPTTTTHPSMSTMTLRRSRKRDTRRQSTYLPDGPGRRSHALGRNVYWTIH